ncbi:deoxyribose-phosphate aldolase [Sphaeroforma arctica JP610]|uniref:deoxyribose-phosphate aldolase n=1 Tax=Sphaeroforma arctica JP610 TaxID=667725 RepID=A0A0L0GE84_9EUKA|nr:deoxyribose-phosphate aldolase [Sphaeroforma arctica JP610]KNC87325.1 deoxyribose-phosphate aldolase [Sphaeroforma arctica JP610]|eukprot:XP_014161227.1 deoxyribose-phosphate aldolase [Sphaeroforma arctica JP610]
MCAAKLENPMNDHDFGKLFDHTILKQDATKEQVVAVCQEAAKHNFMSVCVNPGWITTCVKELEGTDVKVCTVIGFPLGATTSESKAYETKNSIENGALEVDMVLNVGFMKDGNIDAVESDIRAVVNAARQANDKVIVKVILETCLLNKDQIKTACELCVKAGADFVKTSTGFSTGGAKAEDIKLMRDTVGKDVGVKASGGIRDYAAAIAMVNAGANRLGCSAGIKIIEQRAANDTQASAGTGLY